MPPGATWLLASAEVALTRVHMRSLRGGIVEAACPHGERVWTAFGAPTEVGDCPRSVREQPPTRAYSGRERTTLLCTRRAVRAVGRPGLRSRGASGMRLVGVQVDSRLFSLR